MQLSNYDKICILHTNEPRIRLDSCRVWSKLFQYDIDYYFRARVAPHQQGSTTCTNDHGIVFADVMIILAIIAVGTILWLVINNVIDATSPWLKCSVSCRLKCNVHHHIITATFAITFGHLGTNLNVVLSY